MNTNGVPTIVRRNHGKGHSYYIDGTKRPGATTVLGKGYPKHLEKWAAEQSTYYAVDNWEELSTLPISERIKLIAGARFLDRDAAARRGTEVHKIARRLIAGEEVEPPEELAGHVDAYVAFLDEWQPQELLVEAPVASTRWGYSGTLDVVADLVDENRWLYDVKTTRSGVFPESALQIAAYRHADYCVGPDGVVVPMLPVDRCGVVWLRGDGSYEFKPVDAGEHTFRVFLAALLIARFADRDDVIGAPLEVTA